MDIYRDAKRLDIYPPLFTDPDEPVSIKCRLQIDWVQNADCLHFVLSLQFQPNLHSAICNLQSAFYIDGKTNLRSYNLLIKVSPKANPGNQVGVPRLIPQAKATTTTTTTTK